MKRIFYGMLVVSIVSLGAWAGVRLTLEPGTSAGGGSAEAKMRFVVEDAADDIVDTASAEGSIEVLAYGESAVATQTPSLTVSLSPSSHRVLTGGTVALDATTTASAGVTIAAFEWDFDGDGDLDLTTSEGQLKHAFAEDGLVSVTVRAVGESDLIAISNVVQIRVVNRAPTAHFASASTAVEGTALAFADLSTDEDGEIVAWLWSFGDGTTSTDSNPGHTYATAGEYVVTLTVTDDDGDTSAWIAAPILVTNAAPVASFTVRQSVAGDVHAITLIDKSSDPSPGARIVHVAWDFGDGTYDVVGSPADEDIYDHVYSTPGIYTITLYVIDDDGTMATAIRTVHVL